MILPIKELRGKKPTISGENTDIYYLNNGLLVKRLKKLDLKQSEYLLRKLQYIKTIKNIEGLNLPVDIILTEYSQTAGYVERVIPGIVEGTTLNFEDYWKEHFTELTLAEISNYILQVNGIVNKCHQAGIINPDLSSKGNVLYDTISGKVYLTDYHDMQIEDMPSKSLSSNIYFDTILYSRKYRSENLWTKNIDSFIIAMRYLYYTTGYSFQDAKEKGYPAAKYREILEKAGLTNTLYAKYMASLYDNYKDNLDIEDSIMELEEQYVLEKLDKPLEKGQIRKFIKIK